MTSILVTGAAGFIGAHVARALVGRGHRVSACDNFNAYYDPKLKQARVQELLWPVGVNVQHVDLTDVAATQRLVEASGAQVVLHLAAQAGVRHSVDAPLDYVQANLLGFGSVLEACRRAGVGHLLHASSSSVYGHREGEGEGGARPFSESDRIDRPASFYAATKVANEAMAHATARVHGLPTTSLRFFTVYGPWGRPDMACWLFSERIRLGLPIVVFGRGELRRDFTYVDDTVEAVCRLIERGAPRPDAQGAPVEIFNVGHSVPATVNELVAGLEQAIGRRAVIEHAPLQVGDVPHTESDPTRLRAAIGDWPRTPLARGLAEFADWHRGWLQRGAGQPQRVAMPSYAQAA
ncbi:NAD-dependent epimerase/dehydratase family protein [Leptothrix discophora]|uniref:NAD-dependent epimerase/dehydratase family protein n=1 Tax=Leptothrix discophora TaxID=89 RepID=A0ABT9G6L1_LEPDI|nr:NAD-dependent epimerase/dehydratase family protein [Leptothrix discophora]MDP4302104.1 NAD-dependent epimerase/dehydratase family protein [Leptothrix discophora]